MTNQERLTRANLIHRHQNSGKITREEASAQFDELLMADSSDLIYCSDSTNLTADWDPDVMLFPKEGTGLTPGSAEPSNTGIYARGPKRGWIVTHPSGEPTNASRECIEHFSKGSKGWEGNL